MRDRPLLNLARMTSLCVMVAQSTYFTLALNQENLFVVWGNDIAYFSDLILEICVIRMRKNITPLHAIFTFKNFSMVNKLSMLELPVLQSKSWPAIISKMLKIKKYFGTVFDYETLQNIYECVFWDWSFPALAWSFQLIPFTKKTNLKITILEILVYKVQPEIIKLKSLCISTLLQSNVHKTCEHGFVIKLKCVKILNFVISGCILYTKISRMVIFGLVFLLYFLKLSVGNGF